MSGARISVSVWHTDTDIKKAHQYPRVGCDSHTRWLGRIITDAILLNGVGDCDGYVRRKVGAHIKKKML